MHSPPICKHNSGIWVWKGYVCFEASLSGLKRGRSPPPPPIANTMLVSGVWRGFIRMLSSKLARLEKSRWPPLCKRNVSSMGKGFV